MKKLILCISFLILTTKPILSHPDGATPFWFPSSYIYGFIEGCWQSVENFPQLTKDLWPEEIRRVCGCVMDSLRHSITFQEADNSEKEAAMLHKFQVLVDTMLPVCLSEVDKSKN